jgi:hypothetical protein
MAYFALIRRLINFSTMDIQAIKGNTNILQIGEELGQQLLLFFYVKRYGIPYVFENELLKR